MAMYGYNGVIRIKSQFGPVFSSAYYGLTTGIGYEHTVGKNQNKLTFAILIPFRSSDFKKEYDDLQDAGYASSPGILPVLLSIGFNIAGYGRYRRP